MTRPQIPLDEPHRLQSLRALNILDTGREERFDRITRLTRRVFQVPVSLISFTDAGRVWFKSAEGIDFREIPRDVSFCGHAILRDDVFVIPDASRDPRFADNPGVVNPPGVRFYAGCPFSHPDGSKLGTLSILDYVPRELDEDGIANLRDLAAVVESELRSLYLSTLDELTRLNNRRGFLGQAQQSLNLCARQGRPASLIFFDLDDFKRINDEFGHAAGDRALKEFAARMKAAFRDSDICARLSGDEFVVLLPNTRLHEAEEVRQRFIGLLGEDNARPGRAYRLTCSSGAVESPGDGETLEELLRASDARMYRSKQGREPSVGENVV